jgi:hypothetical protein
LQEVYEVNPAEIYRLIPIGVAQVVVKVVVNSLSVMGVGLQKAGDLIVASPRAVTGPRPLRVGELLCRDSGLHAQASLLDL